MNNSVTIHRHVACVLKSLKPQKSACLFYVLLMSFLFPFLRLESFDKVVIWGHKLHSHTHSYVHQAFYEAFQYLGYPTYWFDNADNVKKFDFSNSLFLTEGQVDGNIPIRRDCKYILHNCDPTKYQSLEKKNWICLQVYTDSVLDYPHMLKIDTCIYYDIPGRCVYMPWGTDLLPHEIDQVKTRLSFIPIPKKVYWIGTIGAGKFGNIGQLHPFIEACKENGIEFTHITRLSMEENQQAISRSYMAPAIVGEWQAQVGYIPCRIFKNISYGKMGMTNSYRVYELFDKKIVYNPNTYQLFYDAQKRLQTLTLDELYELMDFVKTKHTYINRIQTLLDFMSLIDQSF